MHGPIAESDSLNPHSEFSQRDVQFSLTQLQNIKLFSVEAFQTQSDWSLLSMLPLL